MDGERGARASRCPCLAAGTADEAEGSPRGCARAAGGSGSAPQERRRARSAQWSRLRGIEPGTYSLRVNRSAI